MEYEKGYDYISKEEIREEEIRKKIITDMIIDKLYNSLKKTTSGKIEIYTYNIDEDDMTYLLEKYDNERFNEYKKMLLKDKKED